MLDKIVIVLGVLALLGGMSLLLLARSFNAKIEALNEQLIAGSVPDAPRNDLPAEVVALAERLGASPGQPAPYVVLRQSGTMRRAPGGSDLRFTAVQTIATANPGFMWRATMDPLRSVTVADYLVAGHGGLEARLFGAIRVAHEIGDAEVDRGEALRYLAELPWNPDAILHDRALDWTVVSEGTIKVATGRSPARAEVTFELGGDGLIRTASAASRIHVDGGTRTPRPWHGRFWDYRLTDGRRVPMQGEVAWVLDGRDFVYWRGMVETWSPGPIASSQPGDHDHLDQL